MSAAAVWMLLAAAAPPPGPRPPTAAADVDEGAVRQAIASVAAAQLDAIDARWEISQRDCAGLIRFAYRTAFRELGVGPEHLWSDRFGTPVDFADAETLIHRSFILVGRDAAARRAAQSGDVIAFRQGPADGSEVFHLMLVVRQPGPSQGESWVVYHPGEKGAAVRTMSLEALAVGAPAEWRPVPENPAFLGVYRFHGFASQGENR